MVLHHVWWSFLYWFDWLTSSLISVMFAPVGSQIHTRAFTFLIIADGVVGAAVLASRNFEPVQRISRHPLFILGSGVFIGSLLILSIPYSGQFGARQLALYFLFIQIAAIGMAGDQNWGTRAIEVLIPLLAFSLAIYPHVRAGFGGVNLSLLR